MGRYWQKSFLLHFCFLGLLALLSSQSSRVGQQLLIESNLKLIHSSVRVDMVAMPTATVQELKNQPLPAAQPIPEKMMEKKEQEVVKSAEVKSALPAVSSHDFLLKLKKISHTNSNPTSNSTSNSASKLTAKEVNKEWKEEIKKLNLAGNKLSQGSVTSIAQKSTDSKEAQTGFQLYASKLPGLIHPNWQLPSYLLSKKLKCRLRLWIFKNGQISRVEVYQSSGDSEFDKRAIQSVNDSAPFPALDDSYSNRGQNGDIILGFPL